MEVLQLPTTWRQNMDAIYSTAAMRDHLKEVKEAARNGMVRITENGNGAYVFCSEEVLEAYVQNAIEEAIYVDAVVDGIERGRAAYAAGDYVEGTEAAKAEVARMRARREAEATNG